MTDKKHIDFLLETLKKSEQTAKDLAEHDGKPYERGLADAFGEAHALAHQVLNEGALVDDREARISKVLEQNSGKNLHDERERADVIRALMNELRSLT